MKIDVIPYPASLGFSVRPRLDKLNNPKYFNTLMPAFEKFKYVKISKTYCKL